MGLGGEESGSSSVTRTLNVFRAEGKEPLEREALVNIKEKSKYMMDELLENGGQG